MAKQQPDTASVNLAMPTLSQHHPPPTAQTKPPAPKTTAKRSTRESAVGDVSPSSPGDDEGGHEGEDCEEGREEPGGEEALRTDTRPPPQFAAPPARR